MYKREAMSQEIANKIKTEFEKITSLSCAATFMKANVDHEPTTLNKSKSGVYVFLNDSHCFKVGKAGSNSQARWNSHHYNLDKTTPSTMPKSILKHKARFKECFPSDKHYSIDNINKENIRSWVIENLSRIEFIISKQEDKFALNLLEAIAQYELKPIFEGNSATASFTASGITFPIVALYPKLTKSVGIAAAD
jgi:hypothetical protein